MFVGALGVEEHGFEGCIGILRGDGVEHVAQEDQLAREEASSGVGGDA